VHKYVLHKVGLNKIVLKINIVLVQSMSYWALFAVQTLETENGGRAQGALYF
jgi:hypothetical protein